MSDYSLPLVTKGLIALNVIIHAVVFLTSTNLGVLAISGQQVWNKGEYYRIVTSAFTHSGIMHILMNMSSLMQLGASLEVQFGSLPFLFLTIWAVFLVGGMYVFIAFALTSIASDSLSSAGSMQTSSVGFSGILFMFAIIDAYHTRAEHQSLFGMCNVPARMYPFILLFAIQFLLPGISFMGHFSGVLIGLLTVYGILEKVCLPSMEFCQYLESSCVCSLLSSGRCGAGYVRCADIHRSFSVVNSSSTGSGANAGVLSALCASLKLLMEYVKHVVNTILYIVGCPVDRIGLWIGVCQATVIGWIDSLRGSSGSGGGEAREAELSSGSSRGAVLGLGGGGGGGAPRYSRLSQSSQHGAAVGTVSGSVAIAKATAAGETLDKDDEMSSSV
jgi:membrane associated rhomboid family serine protease